MRKLVTIQEISSLSSIKGADKIELAKIKGWQVVVLKGLHQAGDKVLYFEIDSFLPVRPEYEFLLKGSSPKKMLVDGKEVEGIRLKTIKLKGEISQGLVMPIPNNLKDKEVGDDVSDELGVIKYEAPISPELSGKVKGSFPGCVPKTDEERIQNMQEVLGLFSVTEKLDGASVTYFKKGGELRVCSRNLELLKGETTQWKLAEELKLENKLPEGIAIQGELVGEGIQKNPLKLKGHHFFCFNVYNINNGTYLDFDCFKKFCESKGLKTVPVISDSFQLLRSVDEMLKFAEGKSLINQDCEREGIVVRPRIETQFKGQRLSFKVISNKYLLNH